MKNKTPWINDKGEFEIKSCTTLAAYVLDKTGVQVQVHKTERYLVFNYAKNGQLSTTKIDLPAGVLYCLSEDDVKPLLDALK
jgi:hypothetical protein